MKLTLTKKAILKSAEPADFINSKCVLTVSVGQSNHEEERFLSTILATGKKFSSCIIMVCDSLQRYTMQIFSAQSLEKLHKLSICLGDEWISRNLGSIQQLKIPYQISRWDEWINHNSFEEKMAKIILLYSESEEFKQSVYNTTISFLDRNVEKFLTNKEQAFHLSRNYLLEECAVMLLLADNGYQFEIYPNQRNDAMDYIYRTLISDINPDLMKAVSIKFKNISYSDNIQKISEII